MNNVQEVDETVVPQEEVLPFEQHVTNNNTTQQQQQQHEIVTIIHASSGNSDNSDRSSSSSAPSGNENLEIPNTPQQVPVGITIAYKRLGATVPVATTTTLEGGGGDGGGGGGWSTPPKKKKNTENITSNRGTITSIKKGRNSSTSSSGNNNTVLRKSRSQSLNDANDLLNTNNTTTTTHEKKKKQKKKTIKSTTQLQQNQKRYKKPIASFTVFVEGTTLYIVCLVLPTLLGILFKFYHIITDVNEMIYYYHNTKQVLCTYLDKIIFYKIQIIIDDICHISTMTTPTTPTLTTANPIYHFMVRIMYFCKSMMQQMMSYLFHQTRMCDRVATLLIHRAYFDGGYYDYNRFQKNINTTVVMIISKDTAYWVQDVTIILFCSLVLATVRIYIVQSTVPLEDSTTVEALVRCKSIHLLSSDYAKSMTPISTPRVLKKIHINKQQQQDKLRTNQNQKYVSPFTLPDLGHHEEERRRRGGGEEEGSRGSYLPNQLTRTNDNNNNTQQGDYNMLGGGGGGDDSDNNVGMRFDETECHDDDNDNNNQDMYGAFVQQSFVRPVQLMSASTTNLLPKVIINRNTGGDNDNDGMEVEDDDDNNFDEIRNESLKQELFIKNHVTETLLKSMNEIKKKKNISSSSSPILHGSGGGGGGTAVGMTSQSFSSHGSTSQQLDGGGGVSGVSGKRSRVNAAPRYATALFRLVWSTVSSSLALYYFRSTNFWPWYLGGTGSTINCWNLSGGISVGGMDSDFDHSNNVLKKYFIGQASYHWHSGAFHILSMILLLLHPYTNNNNTATTTNGGFTSPSSTSNLAATLNQVNNDDDDEFAVVDTQSTTNNKVDHNKNSLNQQQKRTALQLLFGSSSTAYVRSMAQHILALALISSAYIFSSLRRLGVIGMFAFDISNWFLHLLQVCINAPMNSPLKSSITIYYIYWLGVIPSFIITRFIIWPLLWYSAIYESKVWLIQLEKTLWFGSANVLRCIFHVWMIIIQLLNMVYFYRLLYHPHLQNVLQQQQQQHEPTNPIKQQQQQPTSPLLKK